MMKKISLIFVFIVLHKFCFGQLVKGTWLVGGTASKSYERSRFGDTNQVNKLNILQISPNIGYFLKDKFALGILPNFEFLKNINYNGSYYTLNTYSFGPFLRYYFLKEDRMFNIFSNISYQYGFVTYNGTFGHIVDPIHINSFSVIFGGALFLNSAVAVELTSGYYGTYTNTVRVGVSSNKTFQTNIGFQIHLKK